MPAAKNFSEGKSQLQNFVDFTTWVWLKTTPKPLWVIAILGYTVYSIHVYAKSARTEGAEAWQFSSEGYEQICSTGAASAGSAVIYTFCISAQHRPDAPFRPRMSSTSANKAPTWAQPTWLQLGPNLGPTCRNLATSWTCLGATSAQVEVHMASNWGTWKGQSEILKTHQNTRFHPCLPRCLLVAKRLENNHLHVSVACPLEVQIL